MRRRLLVVAVCVAFASLLLAAPVLAGGPWKVVNKAGKTLGKVKTLDTTGVVHSASGADRGNVFDQGDGDWRVVWYTDGGAQDRLVFYLSHKWYCMNDRSVPQKMLASCVKQKSRWALRRLVGGKWVVRGYVSARCPGWLAVGADLRLVR